MRLLRALLLILAMLGGQAHACSGSWVLPSGDDCTTCAKGPCTDENFLTGAASSATIGPASNSDCHACCTLQACERDGEGKAPAQVSPVELEFVLPADDIGVPMPPALEIDAAYIHIEAGFPNAPPIALSTRAPPAPLS